MEMGKFSSDDHCLYYCGREYPRSHGVINPHSQQKSLKYTMWVQRQKPQNDLHSFPRQIIQCHSNQVYAPTTNAKEAKVDWFFEDLQHLPEITPKKDVLFIIGDWNAKVES